MKTKRILVVLLVLAMIMSFSVTLASAQEFEDVAEDHPYKVAIDFCQTKGFIKGTSATTFEPDAKLTRAQLATLWCRTLQLAEENPGFTDITGLKNYFDTPVIVLNSLGIIKGTSETTFSPNDYVTREQIAVLTMRTYDLGVADEDAYKRYGDAESISEWARDGVSACLNAEVFDGLYDGENFVPAEPVTRAEICKLIFNLMTPFYDVTIGPLEGGTITASHSKARAGTIISLTIEPDEGKQLKAGSLKYNETEITGNSFVMPAEDVVITAEFEDEPVTLESITITNEPTKKTYTVGETLDLSGLTVQANYSDGSSVELTDYTTEPKEGSVLETEGTVTVTVSYTEGEVTVSDSFDVEVTAAEDEGEDGEDE